MSLSSSDIEVLLRPYLASAAIPAAERQRIFSQLEIYLGLLLKWNARLNLTAIREPEEMIQRHFGESLFAGLRLFPDAGSYASASVLDFGSGAGFPGLPIHILRPELAVTLAESRQRKAAFLLEVVRTLGLPTQVWAGRVEDMPANRRFDVVTFRAVDDMEEAVVSGAERATDRIGILNTEGSHRPEILAFWRADEDVALPDKSQRRLTVYRKH